VKIAMSPEDNAMTAKRDQQSEAVWLGTTHAAHVCAMMHAKGMLDGRIAASAHSPEFLSIPDLLQAAWEVSSIQREVLYPAQQDEYFVGWVQGYVRRSDETFDEVTSVQG
jgi:hypothetical protein